MDEWIQMYIHAFNLKEQLALLLQNVYEVKQITPALRSVFTMCDSTRQNGLVTWLRSWGFNRRWKNYLPKFEDQQKSIIPNSRDSSDRLFRSCLVLSFDRLYHSCLVLNFELFCFDLRTLEHRTPYLILSCQILTFNDEILDAMNSRSNVHHSGDLNTGLVWYSNGQKLSDHQMVRYSNAIWILDWYLKVVWILRRVCQSPNCYSSRYSSHLLTNFVFQSEWVTQVDAKVMQIPSLNFSVPTSCLDQFIEN